MAVKKGRRKRSKESIEQARRTRLANKQAKNNDWSLMRINERIGELKVHIARVEEYRNELTRLEAARDALKRLQDPFLDVVVGPDGNNQLVVAGPKKGGKKTPGVSSAKGTEGS